jgi:flagellar biosynthesis protein FliP
MASAWGRRVRVKTVVASVAAFIVSATPFAAQDISINLGQGAATRELNERLIQLIALLAVLSLVPSINLVHAHPNSVVISPALF